jgi:hypothetical protein
MKNGCFSRHSYQPSAGTRQRRRASALRNAGFVSTVSARALMSREAIFRSPAQDGISPQRSVLTSRCSRCTTTDTGSVGATFHDAGGGSSTATAR